ncbi:MAG: PqqD family protein [Bacteroidaceae bacterium]|nr:PqqD family protein [Bacteroidaceae bacterium]
MRIKKGFELRHVCGEDIIVAYGRENIDFNKVIGLNESATYLWKNIFDKDFNAETMANLLCQEYEVDAETASKDAKALLDDWINVGLVQE